MRCQQRGGRMAGSRPDSALAIMKNKGPRASARDQRWPYCCCCTLGARAACLIAPSFASWAEPEGESKAIVRAPLPPTPRITPPTLADCGCRPDRSTLPILIATCTCMPNGHACHGTMHGSARLPPPLLRRLILLDRRPTSRRLSTVLSAPEH